MKQLTSKYFEVSWRGFLTISYRVATFLKVLCPTSDFSIGPQSTLKRVCLLNIVVSIMNFPGFSIGLVALASGYALWAKPQARPNLVPLKSSQASETVSSATHSAETHLSAMPKKVAAQSSSRPTFERDVMPLIQQFCIDCHSDKEPPGGVGFDKYPNVAAVLKDGVTWENVAKNVDSMHMPPAKKPQPTRAQRDRLVAWVESTLSQASCDLSDPGRVTLRRLNREEYNNSVHDIFGVDWKPAADFPSDDIGYGFDNIGDVLSISPLLMEKYLNASEKISMQAIVAPDGDIRLAQFGGDKFEPNKNAGYTEDGARFLSSTAEVGVDYQFPAAGEYILRARACAQQAGPEAPKMPLKLDGRELKTFEVKAVEGAPATYEQKLVVPKGKHRVSVGFTNDFYDETLPVGKRDRNLIVESIEIEGPRLLSPQPTASQRKIMPRPIPASAPERAHYAREIMTKLARRAFRRPASPSEIQRLARYVESAQKQGDSFERGVQVAIQAMLVSPHFLFRVELDPQNPKSTRKLNDFELATRLSYFLWSSTPDESLLWWAEQGKLHEPKNLAHQVRRMLKDPRASALSSNFAMQWLELRRLNDITPDPATFPEFTNELRAAMQSETTLFCSEIIRNDRSILDFLDAKFTYLNEPLAKLYGIEGVKGAKFSRVVFSPDQAKQRGGLLTQASVLSVTSNPTRTSPVKRGKWVLGQIMGAAPPPPPPNVPILSEDKGVVAAAPIQQRMAQHRRDPNCASCHARMDPIGFGLENYNAIGAWRTQDGKFSVDAKGELSPKQKFNGPLQLRAMLKQNKSVFARSLSEKMLTYAIGRGVERNDKCFVDAISQSVAKNDYRFSALILAVVQSDPFLTKRGDKAKK